ncbi:hypothetical protein CONPUDRAFT_148355 [Coniophora puteana RWD-64-598 SS2]|uniref:Uncharacterized protein n=1 Tax=Coniophora puteana (strain RWD-64-598) TaxID=741705 RepID=A0A5M3N4B0_CONPW|nr:uncharacterized protein CONPUDRAFT_148355 [Coniophora puteana RWD-64-598 SS2]EIW86260.1 hypothetical protein CONPUDRAFT_148355 [Coniophora puteana RWD-64-598 SS2]
MLKKKTHNDHIPEDAELVLELEECESRAESTASNNTPGGEVARTYQFKTRYYFVSHSTRRLFWVENFDITPLFEDLKGVRTKSHMGLAVEQQYWQHCEFFPYNRPVGENIVDELKEIVFHYTSEMITSDTSLTPFDEDELSKVRDIIEHVQGQPLPLLPFVYAVPMYDVEVKGKTFDHSVCIIARLMRILTRNRFFHFHGQTVARLNSDQPLFPTEDGKAEISVFMRVIMFMLFNAPHSHLARLRAVWIDRVVNQVPWKKFINGLNTEWKGYTLYSTVLLAVNLSLLALYNVMPQGTTDSGMHPQTVAEIMSYVSTTWSVGSVVTSLVLVRQNETNSRQSIDEAVDFLTSVSSNKHGIEMLAIIHSLPFAFLLWGVLFFSMAFLALSFQDTLIATRVAVMLASAITVSLVLWPVVVARDFLTAGFWIDKMKSLERAWKKIGNPWKPTSAASAYSANAAPSAGAGTAPIPGSPTPAAPDTAPLAAVGMPAAPPAKQSPIFTRGFKNLWNELAMWLARRNKKMDQRHMPTVQAHNQPRSQSQTTQRGVAIAHDDRSHAQAGGSRVGGSDVRHIVRVRRIGCTVKYAFLDVNFTSSL